MLFVSRGQWEDGNRSQVFVIFTGVHSNSRYGWTQLCKSSIPSESVSGCTLRTHPTTLSITTATGKQDAINHASFRNTGCSHARRHCYVIVHFRAVKYPNVQKNGEPCPFQSCFPSISTSNPACSFPLVSIQIQASFSHITYAFGSRTELPSQHNVF